MKRKPIIILTSCLLVATFAVLVLFVMSNKIVHEPNNFLRSYPSHLASRTAELDIKYNSYYIAGVTSNHIYLGNVTDPFHLLITNMSLTDTSHIKISIKNEENLKLTTSLRVKVDSPYFYMTDGTMPGIFRGKIDHWYADRFMFDSAYFSQSVPIDSTSFALRAKSTKTLENVLGKQTNGVPHVELNFKLLQKQIDGIFCTDGLLHYSKELKRLVYLYHYRNEYIVYDTNLNLDYRGHTIDTFSRAQVKVASIASDKAMVLASKPKVINMESCVSGHYLFINSNLLARNDLKDIFPKVSIVDVYDLRNNKYKLSFYVQNHYSKDGPRKMGFFQVVKNKKLVAIHNRYLVIHDLKSQYF